MTYPDIHTVNKERKKVAKKERKTTTILKPKTGHF